MQHRLSRTLLLRGGRFGGEKHEVEIAERRHLAATSATKPDKGEIIADWLVEHPFAHDIIGEANELVVQEGRRLRCGAAVPRRFGEALRDFGATIFERPAQSG